MMRSGSALIVTALAWAAPVTTAAAQDSTLSVLLAEAGSNNPEIAAARRAAEAAGARVPQAGALPDPVLSAGVMNFPLADPGLGHDFMTMVTVGISERFPFPGKLGLKEEAARWRSEVAEWEAVGVRRKVLAEVKAAYYELYFLDRALAVTGRNETLLGEFAHLTLAEYGVGEGAQSDVLKAQVERTRLQEQMAVLRGRRAALRADLNALLGRPTAAPLPEPQMPARLVRAAISPRHTRVNFTSATLGDDAAPGLLSTRSDIPKGRAGQRRAPAGAGDTVPSIPPVERLQRMALEHNPDIQAHVRRIAAQKEMVALAEKAALPDLSVSLRYAQRSGFGDMLSASLAVPLPIFAGRKQSQAVVEEGAILASQQAMHRAMVNEVNAEIASLAADLSRIRTQLVLLDQGILPQARASLASATASYRVGRVDFLSLLDSQVTLYRHELDYHRLLSDFATGVAELERVVGTEVLR